VLRERRGECARSTPTLCLCLCAQKRKVFTRNSTRTREDLCFFGGGACGRRGGRDPPCVLPAEQSSGRGGAVWSWPPPWTVRAHATVSALLGPPWRHGVGLGGQGPPRRRAPVDHHAERKSNSHAVLPGRHADSAGHTHTTRRATTAEAAALAEGGTGKTAGASSPARSPTRRLLLMMLACSSHRARLRPQAPPRWRPV
jgi:hypothetical protein